MRASTSHKPSLRFTTYHSPPTTPSNPSIPPTPSPPSPPREFFFNFILPRRENVDGEWIKIEFGRRGGSLYPVWSSTPFDLRDFGLGVAM